MALAQKKQPYMSPEEFLEIRRTSDVPLEYMDGEMVAMAGSTKSHGKIVSAVNRLVGNFLADKPCDTSVGISIAAPTSYLIPDLVVYCDGGDFTSGDDILRNPIIIFEVLSDSTERNDRGPKWMRYQQIESLMHYVMIAQHSPTVEVFTRETQGDWHYKVVTGLDGVVMLSRIGVTLALADIYQRVEFLEAASS